MNVTNGIIVAVFLAFHLSIIAGISRMRFQTGYRAGLAAARDEEHARTLERMRRLQNVDVKALLAPVRSEPIEMLSDDVGFTPSAVMLFGEKSSRRFTAREARRVGAELVRAADSVRVDGLLS